MALLLAGNLGIQFSEFHWQSWIKPKAAVKRQNTVNFIQLEGLLDLTWRLFGNCKRWEYNLLFEMRTLEPLPI